jgi:hypothetical protein
MATMKLGRYQTNARVYSMIERKNVMKLVPNALHCQPFVLPAIRSIIEYYLNKIVSVRMAILTIELTQIVKVTYNPNVSLSCNLQNLFQYGHPMHILLS